MTGIGFATPAGHYLSSGPTDPGGGDPASLIIGHMADAKAARLWYNRVVEQLTVDLSSVCLFPLLKFALASLVSVPICFAAGGLLQRLPGAGRIL